MADAPHRPYAISHLPSAMTGLLLSLNPAAEQPHVEIAWLEVRGPGAGSTLDPDDCRAGAAVHGHGDGALLARLQHVLLRACGAVDSHAVIHGEISKQKAHCRSNVWKD